MSEGIDERQAFSLLEKWLIGQERIDSSASISDWQVSRYEAAWVFAPKELRGNRIYLVRGTAVGGFSPSLQSLADAYANLDS